MSEKRRKGTVYQPRVAKRPRQSPVLIEATTNEESSSEEPEEISPESITIAIFCALVYEAVAIKYTLDEEYLCRPKGIGPKNYVYSFGRIAKHKVVIARPHQMGTVEAAHCATAVSQQFPNVRLALMAGIGAGLPNLPKHDIRLGDLAVSIPQDGHPGVIQYDFVKYEQDGVTMKGCLNKPPSLLISADGSLLEDEMMEKYPMKKILQKIISLPKFARPCTDDILFDENFHHVKKGSDCSGCEASSEKKVVVRSPRPHHQPIIHRGLILSGNGVVKDPQVRDRLQRGYNDAICFEMEAAGIMDEIPCLIVRGICDYADTHKQDSWRYYAAAVAAAYCKALLRKVDSQELEETRSMRELIKGIEGLIAGVDQLQERQSCTQSIVDNIDQNVIFEKLHPVKEASFDSYIGEDEGECLPGTRTELLEEVAKWGLLSSSRCIFWLNGMAGTGKSTISRTVGALFKKKNTLGASFFFKRGEGDRGSAKRLFPTIAWQLLARVPKLTASIRSAIQNDPDISAKSLKEQFDKLIINPLHDLEQQNQRGEYIVLVIDALDECELDKDIGAILRLLPQLKELKAIYIRIFLTSRPELPIRLGFQKHNDHQNLVLHELPVPVIKHDIRLFLKHQLSEIRDERALPPEWPGKENIETLVRMAVPLFTFAATACRFIKGLHPKKRLRKYLEFQTTTTATLMDKIYLPVLNQLKDNNKDDSKDLIKEFQDIVGVIILLATPLSIESLALLLHIPADDIRELLDPLHSVLNISRHRETPVRILHLSFRDYLLTTESPFYINEQETHRKIALYCLRVMDTRLKHNICDLASYGTQYKDIDSQIINQRLTADLQYSCRYLVYHLKKSEGCISESEILSFLKKRFLHWLEALALTRSISEAVRIIDILESSVWKTVGTELSDFLYDAKMFTLKNAFIASIAPLQLYSSGLVFAPVQSTIKETFSDDIFKNIQTLPVVEDSWSPSLQTLEGHSSCVQSVAFSPDGLVLASGSNDNTIRLWDTKTATPLQVLEGHLYSVNSVAFSPDGLILASGSKDKIINLWDTKTGTSLLILKGHSGLVNSVAFSPDGLVLASGSDDKTIRLWDTKTGTSLLILKGHSGLVNSVAFSPSGLVLASGSDDSTIGLWDTKTGTLLQILKGHSSWVRSVAFSPDGLVLASGSDDKTVRLWDTKTGTPLQILKVHSSWVRSVAFSPDGLVLVSRSHDNSVGLWDTKTGTPLQILEGYADCDRISYDHESQVSLSKSWVTLRGENLLWLPAEYRNFLCFAVKDATLALGYGDGRVCIIGFHAP